MDCCAEETEDVSCAVEGESCDEIVPELLVNKHRRSVREYIPRSETKVAVYEEKHDEETNSKEVCGFEKLIEAVSDTSVSIHVAS